MILVLMLILLSSISASIAFPMYKYMTVADIDRALSTRKNLLDLEEAAVEIMAHRIHDLEGQMEELGGQEDHLLSQYNELNRGLYVCKIGMKHDYQRALNQTLLVQVLDRKKLLSTLSDMSQVNTQILELMDEKLKLQELFVEIEQFIPQNRQHIIELQSRRHYLQSQSQSQNEQVDEDSHYFTRMRKHATKQSETTVYDYSSAIPSVVVCGVSVFIIIGITVVRLL